MLSTVRAIVREGKIELLESVEVPDGTELLITILPRDEQSFWLTCSEAALASVWGNPEDDVYGDLLND